MTCFLYDRGSGWSIEGTRVPPFLFIHEEDSHRPLLNKTIENYFEICIFLNEQGKKNSEYSNLQ